jgi:hypothetical protein
VFAWISVGRGITRKVVAYVNRPHESAVCHASDKFWSVEWSVYLGLRICCLFNDAASSWDYIASNGRITNEQWIGNDVDR